jgi:hypothetical protein
MTGIKSLLKEFKFSPKLKEQEHIRYNSQSATIQIPHHTYVDKALRSHSFEELMWRFMDAESPAKEISESYGCFSNMKKVCKISDFNWFHIGDGAYTRTAAIFAFFSKSINWSIDPQINMEKFIAWHDKHKVENIFPIKQKFEEVSPAIWCNPYCITCVHAHIDLEELDKKFPEWVFLYSNPCCYPQKQTFSEKYMKENNISLIVRKLDLGILSERRNVYIYYKDSAKSE